MLGVDAAVVDDGGRVMDRARYLVLTGAGHVAEGLLTEFRHLCVGRTKLWKYTWLVGDLATELDSTSLHRQSHHPKEQLPREWASPICCLISSFLQGTFGWVHWEIIDTVIVKDG